MPLSALYAPAISAATPAKVIQPDRRRVTCSDIDFLLLARSRRVRSSCAMFGSPTPKTCPPPAGKAGAETRLISPPSGLAPARPSQGRQAAPAARRVEREAGARAGA